MKYKKKIPKYHKEGDTKIIEKFLILPLTLKDSTGLYKETRWLEKSKSSYEISISCN